MQLMAEQPDEKRCFASISSTVYPSNLYVSPKKILPKKDRQYVRCTLSLTSPELVRTLAPVVANLHFRISWLSVNGRGLNVD